MRKTILASAIGILVLTGCASGPSNYQKYADTQRQIAEARSKAEIARYEALGKIANQGDSTTRVAAVIALQQGVPQSNHSPSLQQPASTGDIALRWASLLVPSLTQFYSISKNTDLAIVNSNNSKDIAINSNETMLGFGKLIVDPVIGTSSDVLLHPQ